MVNYVPDPSEPRIAYLTADDLIHLIHNRIELDTAVEEIRFTQDAGELVRELSEEQINNHAGQWDE